MGSKHLFKIGLVFFIWTISILAYPIEIFETTLADFESGTAENIDVISPDPDGIDDGALIFTENDSIYVLQVYPEDHCTECLSDPISTYEDHGMPRLTFGIYLIEFDDYNSISSASDLVRVRHSVTGRTVTVPLDFFHIIFFGIANGFGGSGNDITEGARTATIEFARLGKGVVFTHDVIAKRWGRDHYDLTWPWEMPCCSASGNYQHRNFNEMTEITGLRAEWVDCCTPDETWTTVHRTSGADADAIVMNVPFELPETFDVTPCHDFGEVHDSGELWYTNADGVPYMHTYNDPDYNSYFAFFSTGHESEEHEDIFRPLEWEAKAMINSMYYAYNGGVGVGDYQSDVKILGGVGVLQNVTWGETTPEYASVTVQARLSYDGTTWTEWFDLVDGGHMGLEFQYFQYRVLMDRGVGRPVFHWLLAEIEVPAPQVTLIYPTDITSCECARVAWLVDMPDTIDLVETSFDATIGPHGFDYTHFRVSGDTLFFEPDIDEGCFEHGDTVTGVLTSVRNTAGFGLHDPDTFTFVVDLNPPEIAELNPHPDTILADPEFDISFTVDDDLAGIDPTLFEITVDGVLIEDGIIYDSVTDRVTIDGDEADIFAAETVIVCITAVDAAQYCGGNSTTQCWSFYVDTIPPTAELIEPIGYSSCEDLHVIWNLSDFVGVDETSISIQVDGTTYDYPDYMVYYTDGRLDFEPPITLDDGETVTIRLSIADNVGNLLDDEIFNVTRDFAAPILINEYPSDGYVIGDSMTSIYFRLDDELSGFDTSTVSIIVNGVTLTPTWDGTRFYVDESEVPHFDDLDTVEVCAYFQDLAEYCGHNSDDTCWHFSVNMSGPIANFLQPDDEMVTTCNEGPLYISIRDVNGVVEESIEFFVDESRYTIMSPLATYEGDTLIFTPSPSWHNGDTINVMVTAAEDSLGNPISDTLVGRFFVDTAAPIVLPIYPHIGGTAAGDPLVRIHIYDEIAGVDPSSIVITVNGTEELRYEDSPAGLWLSSAEDTIYLDFAMAGLTFDDTAYIEIQIADDPDFCDPNSTSFEYFFMVDMIGPEAYFIDPDSGVYSSCEEQQIRMWLYDDNGIDFESMIFDVNGTNYSITSSELSMNGDTLIYSPYSPYAHGTHITASLNHISDTLGNTLSESIFTEFFIDLMAPELDYAYPPMDTILIGEFYKPAWFVVSDDMSGLDIESLILTANIDTFESDNLTIDGDTINFDPARYGFAYHEGDSIRYNLFVSDHAKYCGPNVDTFSTRFFVPDDDSVPPLLLNSSPMNWVQDSTFYINLWINDTSDIYIPGDISDDQAPFIEWDIDGELDITSNRIYIREFIDTTGDSLYRTMAPIPAQDGDVELLWRVSCYDNDYDLDNRDDRSRLYSEIHLVNIAPRPGLELVYPPHGSIIACQDIVEHQLKFAINSEEPINDATIELTIDGELYTITDYRLTLRPDDTLIFIPDQPFDQGSLMVRAAGVSDIYGYTSPERHWHLVFDFSPPQIWFDYPEPGQMLPQDAPYVEFDAMDYFSEVNESAFMAYILSSSMDTISIATINDNIITNEENWGIDFAGFDYSGYDSFTIIVYAEDSPDICAANWRMDTLKFWIEPDLICDLSTNPFTPNEDGFNDRVAITFPNLYSLGGKIEIFDMRGLPARTIRVGKGEIEKAVFDGKSDNGKDLPAGTYLYIVTVDGERVCKGTLTLIR